MRTKKPNRALLGAYLPGVPSVWVFLLLPVAACVSLWRLGWPGPGCYIIMGVVGQVLFIVYILTLDLYYA
jgi:hypothetical protein